jgi:hypothetical protein
MRIVLIGHVICLVSTVVICDWVLNAPRAAEAEERLSAELSALNPPPGAVLIRRHASRKPKQALAGESYQSSLNYDQLSEYYDREMARGGWQFVEERPVRDWGRDFGGAAKRYEKGGFTAELVYPGENSDAGYTYGLDLSWGLH